MSEKKYLSDSKLSLYDSKLKAKMASDDASTLGSAKSYTDSELEGFASEMDEALDALTSAVNGKAPSVHGHAISDVTGLQSELNGKSDADHTHTVDSALSTTSTNPVQNKIVNEAIKDAKSAGTTAQNQVSDHTSNKSNPHGVTKSQVGLGNVDNTSDANKPVSTAQATAIADAKKAGTDAQSNIDTHTGNKNNPHGVTAEQLGLGNVQNVSTNDQTPTYTAATSLSALTSGEKMSVAFGKIAKAISSLISHLANTSNPHSVTKEQVGLGNVDNTADSAKTVKSAGTCTGNAATATKLAATKKITLTGDVTGSVDFDGSGDVSMTATIADDSHNHVIDNVDGLQDALNAAKIPVVETSGTGAAYTATVEGMSALTAGAMVVIIPHTASTSTTATLNVNNLGAKQMRQITSYASGAAVAPASASFLGSGKPVLLIYNGTYWIQLIGRANAADFYGTLAITKGGTGADNAADARANLGITPANIGAVALSELSAQVQSLIDSGVIEVGAFKSPIKATSIKASTSAVTGSGKGKLFITQNPFNNNKITLIIDGVTLFSDDFYPSSELVSEFEFTQSFSIKSSDSSYRVCAVAVFY